jgi:hypothetical protein
MMLDDEMMRLKEDSRKDENKRRAGLAYRSNVNIFQLRKFFLQCRICETANEAEAATRTAQISKY